MSILKQGFTQPQIQEIYDFLKWVNECNQEGSGCKVDSLQMFKDKHGNFYAAYYFHGISGGVMKNEVKYIKIDKEGVRTNLNHVFTSLSALSNLFDTFYKIKL